MMLFLFLVCLFVVCVGGGNALGKGVGNSLFPDKSNRRHFTDRSVHHHYHNVTHHHEHKNITIIDDQTKKKILELKDDQDKN